MYINLGKKSKDNKILTDLPYSFQVMIPERKYFYFLWPKIDRIVLISL